MIVLRSSLQGNETLQLWWVKWAEKSKLKKNKLKKGTARDINLKKRTKITSKKH